MEEQQVPYVPPAPGEATPSAGGTPAPDTTPPGGDQPPLVEGAEEPPQVEIHPTDSDGDVHDQDFAEVPDPNLPAESYVADPNDHDGADDHPQPDAQAPVDAMDKGGEDDHDESVSV